MSTTQAGAATPNPAEGLSARTRLIATIGAALALALASIDISVVSTAMPDIAADLDGLNLYSWVGVGYAVASAVLIPVAGKLGDMFGRKPFLLVGLAGLIGLSLACGLAQNMTQLVVFRVVQGIFAAFLMANIFTLAADVYTAENRTKVQGIFFSVSGLSMVVGPPVGGFITDHWSWRWVFYVAIPIGVVSFAMMLAAVPRVASSAKARDIDFAGMAALIAGLVPILIALSLTGDNHAWTSPGVLVPLVVGAVMLVVFFLIETRVAENPIVPFGMFRSNQVSVMAGVAFVSAFAMMGTLYYVPLLYQGVLGVSATYSGSLVIPMTLALMLIPPFATKALLAVKRYRVLGVLAFALMALGFVVLTRVDADSSHALPLGAMILIGVGIAIAFPMATSVTQSAVDMKQIGTATSQIQFWRMIAGPVCLAILGSIFTSSVGTAIGTDGSGLSTIDRGDLAHGLHLAFVASFVVSLIGVVICLVLREVPIIDMKAMMKKMSGAGPKPAGPTDSSEGGADGSSGGPEGVAAAPEKPSPSGREPAAAGG